MTATHHGEEHANAVLRTTTDIVAHASVQLDYCATVWPQFQRDANRLRNIMENLVEKAAPLGYIAKGAACQRPAKKGTP